MELTKVPMQLTGWRITPANQGLVKIDLALVPRGLGVLLCQMKVALGHGTLSLPWNVLSQIIQQAVLL